MLKTFVALVALSSPTWAAVPKSEPLKTEPLKTEYVYPQLRDAGECMREAFAISEVDKRLEEYPLMEITPMVDGDYAFTKGCVIRFSK